VLPLAERFWPKVDKNGPVPSHCPELGPCWVWTGATQTGGYGFIGVGSGRCDVTHRVSWVLEHGAIPDGQWVLHRCDNRQCVRPSHLFLGTSQDNVDDMMAKGRRRIRKGEGNAASKLTAQKVRDLRASAALCRVSQAELARAFGISVATVADVVHRRSWAHVRWV
jgi:hypothetical protein